MSYFVLFSLFAAIGTFSGLSTVRAVPVPHPFPQLDPLDSDNDFLLAHNVIRAAHGVDPLTWSSSLADSAGIWANTCQFKHSDGALRSELYGENIVAATGPFSNIAAVETFVQDAAPFNVFNPAYTDFTQLIWKDTTQVGCAMSECDGIFNPLLGKAKLVVCLYDPVGNIVGQSPNGEQFPLKL